MPQSIVKLLRDVYKFYEFCMNTYKFEGVSLEKNHRYTGKMGQSVYVYVCPHSIKF